MAESFRDLCYIPLALLHRSLGFHDCPFLGSKNCRRRGWVVGVPMWLPVSAITARWKKDYENFEDGDSVTVIRSMKRVMRTGIQEEEEYHDYE